MLTEANQLVEIDSQSLNLKRDAQLCLIHILNEAYSLIDILLELVHLLIKRVYTSLDLKEV